MCMLVSASIRDHRHGDGQFALVFLRQLTIKCSVNLDWRMETFCDWGSYGSRGFLYCIASESWKHTTTSAHTSCSASIVGAVVRPPQNAESITMKHGATRQWRAEHCMVAAQYHSATINQGAYQRIVHYILYTFR